jgi:hypothetical protein
MDELPALDGQPRPPRPERGSWWRDRPTLERWTAIVRTGAGGFLLLQSQFSPPAEPEIARLTGLALIAIGIIVLLAHWSVPRALADDRVRGTIFALDCLAAAVVLADYARPGDLTWVLFVFVILSGATRWQLPGAAIG